MVEKMKSLSSLGFQCNKNTMRSIADAARNLRQWVFSKNLCCFVYQHGGEMSWKTSLPETKENRILTWFFISTLHATHGCTGSWEFSSTPTYMPVAFKEAPVFLLTAGHPLAGPKNGNMSIEVINARSTKDFIFKTLPEPFPLSVSGRGIGGYVNCGNVRGVEMDYVFVCRDQPMDKTNPLKECVWMTHNKDRWIPTRRKFWDWKASTDDVTVHWTPGVHGDITGVLPAKRHMWFVGGFDTRRTSVLRGDLSDNITDGPTLPPILKGIRLPGIAYYMIGWYVLAGGLFSNNEPSRIVVKLSWTNVSSPESASWHPMPHLPAARSFNFNLYTWYKDKEVLITGGGPEHPNTTHLLFLNISDHRQFLKGKNETHRWIKGPALPKDVVNPIAFGQSPDIKFNRNIYILGGDTEDTKAKNISGIILYAAEENKFELLDFDLKQPRNEVVLITLPFSWFDAES